MHQVWARHGPARPATVEEFAADPTMLGFLFEQGDQGRWAFRRHPAVTRALDEVGAATPDGVPAARAWLAAALHQAHPDHPWRGRL